MCDNDERIDEWVQLAIKNEDLISYNIDVHGKSSKDEGYLGNIIFVRVSGKTTAGQIKSLNLVIKVSKDSTTLRQQAPIKEAFEKEIYIYDRIVTTFNLLQKEMGTKELLDILPKCYATDVRDDVEVLILENLKSQGYGLSDRKIPMTSDQVRLILQAYGQWHAFSLALRYQKKDIFEKLVKDNVNLFGYFLTKVNMIELILENFINARNVCISSGKVDALEQLQFTKDDVKYILNDFLSEDPDYQVLLHGDCWNNNFMFKFQENTQEPIGVRIIDWQCSGLGSPVIDLSHFIYSCNDTGTDKDVGKLLEIYHKSLSDCLRHLGCDANKVFPYNKLTEHWKKFSRYGLIMQAFVLKFSMCEADDAPDFAEAAEKGKDFLENFNIEITNEEVYYKRVENNLQHYIDNLKFLE